MLVFTGGFPETDLIVLGDELRFLHAHNRSYTFISNQPPTQVTPISCSDCPRGILFATDNSLQLESLCYSFVLFMDFPNGSIIIFGFHMIIVIKL